MRRHRANHLIPTLAHARAARHTKPAVDAVIHEVNRPLDLLKEAEDLLTRARELLDKAEAEKKYAPATAAIRECTRLLDLFGRLQGDLHQGTRVNIYVSQEWSAIRSLIMRLLGPHPELRDAFVAGLRELQAGAEQ